MTQPRRLGAVLAAAIIVLTCGPIAPAGAQVAAPGRGAELRDAPGRDIYAASCANCHGPDGAGLDRSLLAFEEELPDFTDCDFAAREPDADWIAVAHEGGPVRGFSEMMPAFRGALTVEQLRRVMAYIRTLCTDASWPRGELNLPRPLLTEKAYPEDEWVLEGNSDIQDGTEVASALVYEYRIGSRSQVEVVVPYGWQRRPGGSDRPTGEPHGGHVLYTPRHDSGDQARGRSDAEHGRGWSHGLRDIALAIKHALFHSIDAGTILSVGGEVVLPTGEAAAGQGAPGTVLEPFVSFGQILPRDAFVQGQAGTKFPLYDGGEAEGFGRLVLGTTITRGPGDAPGPRWLRCRRGEPLIQEPRPSWTSCPRFRSR